MAYKMIVAVINNADRAQLTAALVKDGFTATRLASTGSFLRTGNSTFLLGVNEADVPKVMAIFGAHCSSRQEPVSQLWLAEAGIEPVYPDSLSVTVGGATVFVLDVDQFKKL